MRFSFPLLIIILFFIASLFLSVRQDTLLQNATEDLVVAAFVHLEDTNNYQFSLKSTASVPRALTVEYHSPTGEVTQESITLDAEEERIITPPTPPRSITVRYHDKNTQEQTLTLYKK